MVTGHVLGNTELAPAVEHVDKGDVGYSRSGWGICVLVMNYLCTNALILLHLE